MFKRLFFVFSLILLFWLCVKPAWAAEEPTIRVGVAKTAKPFIFIASTTYRLVSDGIVRLVINPGEEVGVSYQRGQYLVEVTSSSFGLPSYLRFVPDDINGFFILNNFERRFDNGPVNYNQYRGVLEYRYSPLSKMPYFINELAMEQYLYGMAEVANSDPYEYVKAMTVAARSYAYSHLGGKVTDKNLFDVYGSTNDQLYLGYVSELNHPNVIQATSESSGEMITYKRRPVTALYFGQSNGKTKTWPKKNGDRPWLKSVVAKYDAKHRLWGHGFGLSMHDAKQRALKDSWTFDQILRYYYTGVEVERIY